MALETVVLTAFGTETYPTDELSPWLDREWPSTRAVPGSADEYGSPVYHDGTVGVGPTTAATTVTTLFEKREQRGRWEECHLRSGDRYPFPSVESDANPP